jgi:hypothetical protein
MSSVYRKAAIYGGFSVIPVRPLSAVLKVVLVIAP